ncbi:MAG: excinuclease ABC subunit UvrA [Patescibacteria group bacterium]|nr:excinuclease ABC subunit UvrA [Patescibacteria group bacterium]
MTPARKAGGHLHGHKAGQASLGEETIVVKGARTHNLKNITVEMPRNTMIAITGMSGSGKSSLAFDTIFAEGQRRYVESLSAYARQFLHKMQKPDVDEIRGLSPAISIDQKSRSNNPRSTVATITEIYDYMRILFARVGKPHCLICGRPISRISKEEILETILKTVTARTTHAKKVFGVNITDARIGIYAPVVVGRKGEYYQMLYDMLGKGYDRVRIDGASYRLRDQIILEKNKTHDIDILVDEIFMSELRGGGDPESRKIFENARERLSEALERAIHEAGGLIKIAYAGEEQLMSVKFMCPYDGFSYPEVEPRLFSFNSPYGACPTCNGLGTESIFSDKPCPTCAGSRLREEALHVMIGGKNIVDITRLSIEKAIAYFDQIELTVAEKEIAKVVLKEIGARLSFMVNVGIEYLTLDRRANTLSGGEAQRIRLASQLGSGLVGALYVLDEPTIGLHQRDNDRLIRTLLRLRDLGNTIIVVEHDEDTMHASDYIVDIGPGAGVHGGKVVVSGYLDELLAEKTNSSKSLTLAYLRGEKSIPMPGRRREPKGKIMIRGGHVFNIKNMDVDVPLGCLNVITGVSGSGKSSFMYEILHKNLQSRLETRLRSNQPINAASFSGSEYASRVILIDQSPIGRTPRSNPATYTGAWTHIRDLFAAEPEARARGWGPGRFSFNRPGGRCEACEGNGEIAVEMHFLPTVYVTCEICGGTRFTKETLEIKFRRKNIHEVLELTIEEALGFFADIPAVEDRLRTLMDVGLGYVKLGQSATTLSGGEAQRVKISSELYRAHLQKTIYLLDEPTVGLHYEDVKSLVDILQKLVDKGNTVVVIEHNLDLIKNADYIIDIGPDGGDRGGRLVAKGTPEDVTRNEKSYTGKYLKQILKRQKMSGGSA